MKYKNSKKNLKNMKMTLKEAKAQYKESINRGQDLLKEYGLLNTTHIEKGE